MELIFKAGNKQEIKASLVNFCKVDKQKITKTNITDIYNKYSNNYEGISNALWEKFHGDILCIKPAKFRAHHYHRTGSNLEKEWFREGILNKDLGIQAFIKNLNTYFDIDLLEFLDKLSSINNNRHKDANEDINYGPYSFISKSYAKKNSGYNLPEIIEIIESEEKYSDIKKEIINKIKPTLVEFWFDYTTEDYLDRYIYAYCGMFIGEDFSEYSVEPNSAVPFENIIEIVHIPSRKHYPPRRPKPSPNFTFSPMYNPNTSII